MLAAGAGAMGVRLGMPVQEVEGMQPRPELGVGEPADVPFLDSTVGLLWRALVVWVFVLMILTIARLLLGARKAPQRQHCVNWAPSVSPQRQRQSGPGGGPSEAPRALAFASSSTQSSAWHSAGGSSPMAEERYWLRISTPMPSASSRFLL